ncbi:hypothetical protein [Erwinia sorbitola]|uniref:Uncharacterized protein n=1 Tax=Erwinia sorbitola TaxID=2681984 RepID=A0A6I6EGL0_9GAMM|nr:hypothetical protein [Erwinia sorbitola]QGU87045.1 hypothetical protein GN242_07365 [Erwinia sorbitola]
MRELTPEQQEHCARLPEYRRASYRYKASRMTDRERQIESIAWDAGRAWMALKAGEPHPRINTLSASQRTARLMTRRYAEQAAFYPRRPEIIVYEMDTTYLDYHTPHYGLGGAVRQD